MYIPENALELLSEFMGKAEGALRSRVSDDGDPENQRIINGFLEDAHRFLAGWCNMPLSNFAYSIEKGPVSHLEMDLDMSLPTQILRRHVEIKGLTFSYGESGKPGQQARLSIPQELKRVLYYIYEIDDHKQISSMAYEKLEQCIRSLADLTASVRSRFRQEGHVVEATRDYSRIWCDGSEFVPGEVLKATMKMIDESGLDGLQPSILKARFPSYDRPYDIFRPSKAGRILWKCLERVGSRQGPIRLKRAIPKRSGKTRRTGG